MTEPLGLPRAGPYAKPCPLCLAEPSSVFTIQGMLQHSLRAHQGRLNVREVWGRSPVYRVDDQEQPSP